ncbi:hypothetical protein SKAU_G00311490 [Synaphobranchus kaupii]|uniref:Uncharacterized protein n=1 Tax=Synaphobranchus kaupii TaxID=118154 RepID=A0A9Q1ERR4_SYNKA|nr:hypothetical protein SKAU_G00311490 [Synaphobranchus kaupii]
MISVGECMSQFKKLSFSNPKIPPLLLNHCRPVTHRRSEAGVSSALPGRRLNIDRRLSHGTPAVGRRGEAGGVGDQCHSGTAEKAGCPLIGSPVCPPWRRRSVARRGFVCLSHCSLRFPARSAKLSSRREQPRTPESRSLTFLLPDVGCQPNSDTSPHPPRPRTKPQFA